MVDASRFEAPVECDVLGARQVTLRCLLRESPGGTWEFRRLIVLVVADQEAGVRLVQVEGRVGPMHAVREEACPLADVRVELNHHLPGDRSPRLLRERRIEAEADLREDVPLTAERRHGEPVAEQEAVA